MSRIQTLAEAIGTRFGTRVRRLPSLADELALAVAPAQLAGVCRELRDAPELAFEQLMDLAGIDYLHHGRDDWVTREATATGFSRGVEGIAAATAVQAGRPRFAVTYQLLSVSKNWRVRLRCPCVGDEPPMLDSVNEIWASANWFEREAFDLFGILFRGHPDLRRILTDYGFVGHPFRKDFPLSGNVEMRYDPELGRVIYEPVSIEPRILVPKVIRDDNRYDEALREAPDRG